MPENLIAVTQKSSMQPLAFQGIMAYQSFPQIREMLRRKFDDDYALLFTKPVENPGDGNIDWYSPVQGQARKLKDLPKDEADAMYDKMASMAREIRDYAEELIKTGEPLKITRGNILRLALSYPDPDSLYAIGGQPVFVGWGFAPGTPGAEPLDLFKLKPPSAPKKPDPEPVPEPEPEPARAAPAAVPVREPSPEETGAKVVPVARPMGCFSWVLPFLLLCCLLFLLFSGFGEMGALSGYTLFKTPAPAWLENKLIGSGDEADNLRSEIDGYRKRIDEKARLCVPEKPAPVAETPSPVVQAPAEELVIPKEATNADFLSGRWLCETGLANARTNQPVTLEFSFDNEGKGRAVTMEDNDRCEGDALASMRDGILYITVSEQKCANSRSSYTELTIRCEEGAGGVALCKGLNKDGSQWDAAFKKY
ncbi:MAG: SrfA family protein [Desulfovibrio sp.]|nr:SrfA family protein [Desulfovibrio sp.]